MPSGQSAPMRPNSAKAVDYRRPLHTFQSYHAKVQQASDFVGQQLRGASEQASISEQRRDPGFGALLNNLRSEAPTAVAADAMNAAMQLKVMDALIDGLAGPLATPLPAGTAV